MYWEWASLSPRLLNSTEEGHSVLEKFPGNAGKEVALAVIRQLASNLGISQPPQPSNLVTDREVQWCMEVRFFMSILVLIAHYCCSYQPNFLFSLILGDLLWSKSSPQ